MITDRIRRLDLQVPRYTSYPTAPHFSPAISGAAQTRWLRDLPDDATLSLYLHVPFCDQLCYFCACTTAVMRHDNLKRDYGDVLVAEIAATAALLRSRHRVSHVHWGGGTPTSLPAETLLAIMAQLRGHFEIPSDAEIAVEIDPRTLDQDRIDALREMGATRASLGVQDFEPIVQRAIGRIQDEEMTGKCVDRLRAIGIRSINLDLLYGLPHQTIYSARRSAETALRLAPNRIAAFGYAHVPWMKRHQKLISEQSLPDAVERYGQRCAIDTVMTQAGYTAIGLDHFARPDDPLARAARNGAMGRNFQGYTGDGAETLLGFGTSAISSFPQGYIQNAAATADYTRAVEMGGLAGVRGVALTQDDRLQRDVINALMCGFAADLDAIGALHEQAPDVFSSEIAELDAFAEEGLIAWDGHTLIVTTAGRPFLRVIAAIFDSYFATAPRRHSRAV